MNLKSKISAVILSVITLFSLTACQSSENSTVDNQSSMISQTVSDNNQSSSSDSVLTSSAENGTSSVESSSTGSESTATSDTSDMLSSTVESTPASTQSSSFTQSTAGTTDNSTTPPSSSPSTAASSSNSPVVPVSSSSTQSTTPSSTPANSSVPVAAEPPMSENLMYISANGTTFTAKMADNSSANALLDLLKNGDITVNAHDYGNFEKVGDLPQSLPRNDEQITTSAGDLILYQGDQFVFYYDTNSWNFTRLGKVEGVTTSQLKEIFGNGNVDLRLSLNPIAPEEKNDVLVAYFSCTGNTEKLAKYAVEITGGDLFEITPSVPYTDADLNYSDRNSRDTVEQYDDSARPEIANKIDNFDDYEIVFIAYPIWWGEAPKIIYTFVESYDFSGKTIIPFCTSGSSGIGRSAENLHSSARGANWLDGARLSSSYSKEQMQS